VCGGASSQVGVGWFPTVKLADFGMAARAPVERTVGTLFYVAPEILTEGYADQASDMWRCAPGEQIVTARLAAAHLHACVHACGRACGPVAF
jgi:serine/threonine protein kinase